MAVAQVERGTGFGIKRWIAAAGIALAAVGGVGLAVSLNGSEKSTSVPVSRQVSSDAADLERQAALKRYHEENAILPATAVAPSIPFESFKEDANTPTDGYDSQAALRRMKQDAAGL